MNSTISDDLPRDHLALEAAKCIENIFANNQNLTLLHKELLEVNLSVTAYIEESKRRLAGLRLNLANEVDSSHEVNKMSHSPSLPPKCSSRNVITNHDKKTELHKVNKFISWYKYMIDNERQNIVLYLSDDAILEWFGRTIKTKKKVSTFLKHNMQSTRHDFVSIQNIDKIRSRQDITSRNEEYNLSISNKLERNCKRRILRSNCNSPEWVEGCQPPDETKSPEKKQLRSKLADSLDIELHHDISISQRNSVKRGFDLEFSSDFNSKGDGVLDRRVKRKCIPVTPPNCELGQGDCMPSTSGTDSDRSHDVLNAQLSKLYVECNGFIQFTRTRNNRSNESMKWERKCKAQICFSEDPLNVGEYIIWAIHYTDESKCRRNLLSAFEEVAKDGAMDNVNQ